MKDELAAPFLALDRCQSFSLLESIYFHVKNWAVAETTTLEKFNIDQICAPVARFSSGFDNALHGVAVHSTRVMFIADSEADMITVEFAVRHR